MFLKGENKGILVQWPGLNPKDPEPSWWDELPGLRLRDCIITVLLYTREEFLASMCCSIGGMCVYAVDPSGVRQC